MPREPVIAWRRSRALGSSRCRARVLQLCDGHGIQYSAAARPISSQGKAIGCERHRHHLPTVVLGRIGTTGRIARDDRDLGWPWGRRLPHSSQRSARRLTRLKCSLIVVAPFWLLGLGVGGWTTLSFILKQVAEAQHYFTLDKAVEVDGITLPAGTRVELDDANALRVAELRDDTTLALRGTMWRGRIEFAEPSHASNAAHGQITDGRCADPACLGKSPPTVPRH
jgi:hypothetical protein